MQYPVTINTISRRIAWFDHWFIPLLSSNTLLLLQYLYLGMWPEAQGLSSGLTSPRSTVIPSPGTQQNSTNTHIRTVHVPPAVIQISASEKQINQKWGSWNILTVRRFIRISSIIGKKRAEGFLTKLPFRVRSISILRESRSMIRNSWRWQCEFDANPQGFGEL